MRWWCHKGVRWEMFMVLKSIFTTKVFLGEWFTVCKGELSAWWMLLHVVILYEEWWIEESVVLKKAVDWGRKKSVMGYWGGGDVGFGGKGGGKEEGGECLKKMSGRRERMLAWSVEEGEILFDRWSRREIRWSWWSRFNRGVVWFVRWNVWVRKWVVGRWSLRIVRLVVLGKRCIWAVVFGRLEGGHRRVKWWWFCGLLFI